MLVILGFDAVTCPWRMMERFFQRSIPIIASSEAVSWMSDAVMLGGVTDPPLV
jgi:hypothetical protein